MLLFFFFLQEDVHFEAVCLFAPSTVVRVGKLNLQEVETVAVAAKINKPKKKNAEWIQQILGDP